MKIKSLHLKNFRLFDDLKIEFDEQLNVFVGENGAGKSTVLEVISRFLDSGSAIESDEERFFVFNARDLNGKSNGGMEFVLEENGIQYFAGFKILGGNGVAYFDSPVDNARPLGNLWAELDKAKANIPAFPIVAFFGDGIQPEMMTSKTFSNNKEFKAWSKVFESVDVRLGNFKIWFEEQEDFENEKRLDEANDYRNPVLEIIRASFENFLSNFSGRKFNNLRIRRRQQRFGLSNNVEGQKTIISQVLINKDKQELEVDQLSNGEKALLMLVFDIARRLAVVDSVFPPREVCANGEGIVIIDEIDLHLHPSWQREVLPALMKTFPKIQFIATTHSPQVLSKIPRKQIFVLEDGKLVKNTPPTLGRDANSILYELFGVSERPIEFQEKLDRCIQLIDDDKFAEAKILLHELAELWGETDGEIVRARTLIELAEA